MGTGSRGVHSRIHDRKIMDSGGGVGMKAWLPWHAKRREREVGTASAGNSLARWIWSRSLERRKAFQAREDYLLSYGGRNELGLLSWQWENCLKGGGTGWVTVGNKTGTVEADREQPESQVEVFRLDVVGNGNHEIFWLRKWYDVSCI